MTLRRLFGDATAAEGARGALDPEARKHVKVLRLSPGTPVELFDGEGAPQGYCAATTRDQAGLLFNEIKRMIRGSSALSQLLDVYKTQIQSPRTNGYIAALSRDGNSADGINPHFAARDEVHRWTDRELADVVTNSMIARAQPIDWA